MRSKGKFLIVFLVLSSKLFAQNNFFDYSSAGLQYFHGSTIGNTFKRLKDSDPYSGEIFYQRQINPGPTWNNTQRLPQWGVGLFATNSGSKKYVGTVVCLYPYMKLPLFTAGKFESNFRIGFGLSWVEKPYDKITNPENLLLSQKINTHVNLSWQNEVKISPHHFIGAGLSFYHVSNAKTSLPNLGINIPAVSLAYRYAFHGETKKPVKVFDSLNKRMFFKVFLSGGVKQMQVPDSSYYFVKILTGEIGKEISYSSTVAFGAFITQDASVKTDPLVTHLRHIQFGQAGMYAAYEYKFGRLSIPVQLGIFIYNSNSSAVESIGFRYKFHHNWMAEMLLKTHGHKADIMHFGIGYRF